MNDQLLRDGLIQIKKQYGIAVLYDERKTMALFADFVPEGRVERNALKHTYISGAMRILLSAIEGSSKPDYVILQAVDALKNNVFMDEKIASQLVDDLCYVLELSIKPQPTNMPSNYTTSYAIDQASKETKTHQISTNKVSTKIKHSFPWMKIIVVAVVLIAIVAIIGLSIYSWKVGQWIIGIILAIAIIALTVILYTAYDVYLPQLWIISGISIVNIVLAWLFPGSYSTMALPVSVGAVVALFICAYYAYDDYEEDLGMAAVVMMACNLVVATSIKGGFSSIVLWLCVCLLPAFLISSGIAAIYEKCDGDNGILISSIVAGVIIGLHVLLVCICPHFVHSLHKYPQLLEKEFGPKKAICYCEEEIEVSQFIGDMIHGYTCEYYNLWKPLESTTYKFDEENHWLECSCGVTLGLFKGIWKHEFENDICKVCGYYKENEHITDERAALYNKAGEYLASDNIGAAAIAFAQCGDYDDASLRCDELWSKLNKYLKQTIIVVDFNYIVWINQDGTVSESYSVYPEMAQWNNISAIAMGMDVVAGLKEDGTVIATESFKDTSYREWRDIVSISAGDEFIVGLKKDGTVLACGKNDFGQCNVSTWTDIVSIQAVDSADLTVGVKSDGSVIVAGDISDDYIYPFETTHLKDIRNVCFAEMFLLNNANRIVLPFDDAYELNWLTESYVNVLNVVNTCEHVVILDSNGKTFCNEGIEKAESNPECDICSEINSWSNIHQLSAIENGFLLIIGIYDDGSLVMAGEDETTKYGYEVPDLSQVRVKVYQ